MLACWDIMPLWSIINKVIGAYILRRNSVSRHRRVTQWKTSTGFWLWGSGLWTLDSDSEHGAANRTAVSLPHLTTPVDESMTDSKLKGVSQYLMYFVNLLHALFGISIQESLIPEHIAAVTCYQGCGLRQLEAAYQMIIYLRACHFAGRYSILSLDISGFSALWQP